MPELASGSSLSAALGLVALALVPLALMTLTSFAKIAVVFSALRNALGGQDVPSSAIVTALALALSVYAMGPVASAIAANTEQLPAARRDTIGGLLESAREPVRTFLAKHAGSAETKMLVELTPGRAADDLSVLWASFALNELKEAFQLAFFVYLPFLALDLIVANALLALGVGGFSPTLVALPFKLLLFVAADGFLLVSRALLLGYR
ncbi:MAG TPA: flagellar type III secretion system pore protein FliP [Polyangiales bacterium]|nr:flagellar type III secretion system pore protein FliP [Polyangiales bacterium]